MELCHGCNVLCGWLNMHEKINNHSKIIIINSTNTRTPSVHLDFAAHIAVKNSYFNQLSVLCHCPPPLPAFTLWIMYEYSYIMNLFEAGSNILFAHMNHCHAFAPISVYFCIWIHFVKRSYFSSLNLLFDFFKFGDWFLKTITN